MTFGFGGFSGCCVKGGRVAISWRDTTKGDVAFVYLLDSETGNVEWTWRASEHIPPSPTGLYRVDSVGFAPDGHVLAAWLRKTATLGSDYEYGVSKLDRDDGSEIWQTSYGIFGNGDGINGQPRISAFTHWNYVSKFTTISGNRVVHGGHNGRALIHILDPDTGEELKTLAAIDIQWAGNPPLGAGYRPEYIAWSRLNPAPGRDGAFTCVLGQTTGNLNRGTPTKFEIDAENNLHADQQMEYAGSAEYPALWGHPANGRFPRTNELNTLGNSAYMSFFQGNDFPNRSAIYAVFDLDWDNWTFTLRDQTTVNQYVAETGTILLGGDDEDTIQQYAPRSYGGIEYPPQGGITSNMIKAILWERTADNTFWRVSPLVTYSGGVPANPLAHDINADRSVVSQVCRFDGNDLIIGGSRDLGGRYLVGRKLATSDEWKWLSVPLADIHAISPQPRFETVMVDVG